MDRRPPRDGVHRAAGPVGQLVQSSVHPSLQVDGSPSGEAWGPRDPVLLGLVIGPCHAEAPPLRHPHSDAPLSVRCSRSRRTPREPLDTRPDLLDQGPCQVDDTALAPVTSRSVISARRRRRLRRVLRLLGHRQQVILPRFPWQTLGKRKGLEGSRPPRPCFEWLRGPATTCKRTVGRSISVSAGCRASQALRAAYSQVQIGVRNHLQPDRLLAFRFGTSLRWALQGEMAAAGANRWTLRPVRSSGIAGPTTRSGYAPAGQPFGSNPA